MDEKNEIPDKYFKVKLGPKGAKPPKKRNNPRAVKDSNDDLRTFTVKFYNGDTEEVDKLLKLYREGNEKIKESLLSYVICHFGVPLRIVKTVFHIGAHKYKRIKQGLWKKKPGGNKPNFVRSFTSSSFTLILL